MPYETFFERLQFLELPAAGRREIASQRRENEREDSLMQYSLSNPG
jgi:hypothetical protein